MGIVTEMKLSKGFQDFLSKEILPNYIVYSRHDKYAFCTFCQSETPIDFKVTKPGLMIKCPKCNRVATLKARGQQINMFSDTGVGIELDNDDGRLCLRFVEVTKTYRTNGTLADYETKEILREYFEEHGRTDVFDNSWTFGWKKCNIRRYSNYKGIAGEPCYHINLNWRYSGTYLKSISNAIKGTYYQYSKMNEIFKLYKGLLNGWKLEQFLMDYAKCHVDEYLYKVGFIDLVKSRVFTNTFPCDANAKELHKILMITKEYYKELLAIGNPTWNDLRERQIKTKYKLNTTEEFILWKKYADPNGEVLGGASWASYRADEFIKVYKFSYKKLDVYAKTQKEFNIRDFVDHLRLCDDLGYDLKNEFVVFPKDLQKTHQEENDERKRRADEQEIEQAKTRNGEYIKLRDEYKKLYEFANEIFEIVVPNGCDEICKEGQNLHHCVGTYVDAVCHGTSVILFVRELSKPDKSFYTMEVVNNTMIQCRGFGNKETTPEVKSFITQFAKEKNLTMKNIA